MEKNINNLISFFDQFSDIENDKNEIGEQESSGQPGAAPAGTAPSSPSVPKWADLYTIKRSKANMLGKKGEKWSTGLNRGLANQIY